MNRRTFILSTTAGLTGVLLYGCGNSDNNSNLYRVWDEEAIVGLGNKYMTAVPEEADATKLNGRLDGVGPDIETKLKEDFIAGRTVQLDGWIISVTEARQCALVSLSKAA